jgi:hypothetical protein
MKTAEFILSLRDISTVPGSRTARGEGLFPLDCLIAGSNFAGRVVVFPLCVFCVVFVGASATSRGRSLVQASPKVSA